jgi:hypothetical protein
MALAEPGETGVKGLYVARTVSKVCGSSEMGNPRKKGQTGKIVREREGGRPKVENDSDDLFRV